MGGTSTGGSTGGGGRGGSLGGGGTAAGGASAGSGGSGGQVTHTGTWKVMPLGDSITGSTCYPQLLSQDFKNGGHTNFAFVGTETSNQSCGNGVPQIKMEGHPGYGVTYLPQNSTRGACTKTSGCGSYTELKTWAAEKPDIVMMHFGTNDVWDGQPTASIISAYLSVISEFRKQNPNVIFFVSKIIKLNPAGCGSCLTNVAALAAAVTPSWASTNSTATSPLYIVDDYDSGYDPDSSTDSSDHVHPLLPGAVKVANATYNGVIVPKYF
jgi:GDSL-like Lipase/Acylhydrolase family